MQLELGLGFGLELGLVLTLTSDLDLQAQESYGNDPCTVKSQGQTVRKVKWKQTDGQTKAIAILSVLMWSVKIIVNKM